MTDVLVDDQEGQLLLTLNRPEKYNAFDVPFIKRLRTTFEKESRRGDVDSIVITGAGKAFCAGGDVGAMKEALPRGPARLFEELTDELHPLIVDIRRSEKPVVAALNGPVAGGGYGLALACDLRIASRTVALTPGYRRLGIVPDGGLTALLPRFVGFGTAQRIILRDETTKAEEALLIGLVDEVVAPEALVERARAVARQLGEYPRESFRLTKELLNAGFLGDLEAQLERERRSIVAVAKGPWLAEGVNSFFEKRDPVFRRRDQMTRNA